jgi:hypothetical protein
LVRSKDALSDNYFPLPTNTQAIPKLGEFFFIGRMKAVIAAPPLHELAMLKDVANATLFDLRLKEQRINAVRQHA